MPSVTIDKTPRTLLLASFLAWKALLLTIAILSPGPGYDTSTQLLFKGHGIRNVDLSHLDVHPPPDAHAPFQGLPALLNRLLLALTRWDAIYFASVAERGYIFEQEWAFGWGFLKFLSVLGDNFPLTADKLSSVLIHGVILANVSHLISVLLLFQLGLALQTRAEVRKIPLAFIAAALHIISPAGIFLVAPFTEAPFSLLSFAGHLLYVYSWGDTNSQHHGPIQDLYLVLSGLCFGVAATVRGNGILNGLIVFYDAVLWLGVRIEHLSGFQFLNLGPPHRELQAQLRSFRFRRLPATIISGMLVGIGFAVPQFIAYQQFCASESMEKRPWCDNFPPSIYSWVQSHYWGVGFLRYWTLSNLPLFLIALPTLYVLLRSGWIAIKGNVRLGTNVNDARPRSKRTAARSPHAYGTEALLVRLALPQFAVACAAFTSFHVQIITRLSSGYPVWYLILAQEILDGKRATQWIVRWMIMYALIQAVLFTSFLPPA